MKFCRIGTKLSCMIIFQVFKMLILANNLLHSTASTFHEFQAMEKVCNSTSVLVVSWWPIWVKSGLKNGVLPFTSCEGAWQITLTIQLLLCLKDIFPKALNDVGFDLSGKGITFPKCIVPNTCYRVWNFDAFEGNTSLKSIISNTHHAIWNIDACERFTIVKSMIPDGCHRVRNVDAC